MLIHMDVAGRTGLVMHNGRLADPLDPLAIELSRLTDKRNRTEEEEREISDFEWFAGLCFAEGPRHLPPGREHRPLPARRGDGMEAGRGRVRLRARRHGSRSPVRTTGLPMRKLQKLPEYQARKTVKIGRNRTPRTRPIFRTWSMSLDIDLDDADLNLSDFERIVERAGRLEASAPHVSSASVASRRP